jgi:hypothetical protein
METIILIVLVVLVVLLLISRSRTVWGLIVNGVIGVILLFLTNLFLENDIPINLVTILICAIGGVLGWLIILVFHLLEVAF